MENPNEKGIIILGLQFQQKKFRPSDWNIRLSQSVLIELHPNYCYFPPSFHYPLGFSSLCMPIHWKNIPSLFVSNELKKHKNIYDFLIKFSQENELQIIQNIEYSQIF
jgi:hypothetical protein